MARLLVAIALAVLAASLADARGDGAAASSIASRTYRRALQDDAGNNDKPVLSVQLVPVPVQDLTRLTWAIDFPTAQVSGTTNDSSTAGPHRRSLAAACADQVSYCASWKQSGYCAPQYVSNGQSVRDVVCAKTCGGAPCAIAAAACADQVSYCASWKQSGYCAPQYVSNGQSVLDVVCAKTCGGAPCKGPGCVDNLSNCPSWAAQGYCAPQYMYNDQSVRDVVCASSCNGAPCGAKSPSQSPPPAGSAGIFAQLVLNRHNTYRQRHQAPALRWSSSLASSAQAYANKCIWAHSGTANVGENLAYGTGWNMADPNPWIDLWYAENTKYTYGVSDPGSSLFPQVGHFTQLVWVATTEVGCAVKSCPNMGVYAVCQYSPPGNYNGQYARNVLPPR